MSSKGPVRVVVRKTGLVPGAKNVDLNSLRRIIEKTQKKLAASSGSTKIQPVANDFKVNSHVTPETVKIKPDPEANNGEATAGDGRDTQVISKGSPLKVVIKVEPGEKNTSNNSQHITTISDIIEDGEGISAKRQKVSGQESSETKTDYSCCFCKFSTKDAKVYRSHIASHLKNKVLNCNSCTFSTDKISVYNDHVRTAHTQKRTLTTMYACPMCSFKAPKMEALRRHQTVTGHSDHRPVQKCKLCSHSDRNVCKMLEHILAHKSEDLIKECKFCDRPEVKKSSAENQHSEQCMEVTVPLVHKYEEVLERVDQPRTFTCTLCDFRSEEQLFLVEHIKAHAKWCTDGNEDDDENPFCCSMCDYRCQKPNRLVAHMKTHKPGTVFRCKTCSFESSDFEEFKAHRKLHSATAADGSKVFSCVICLMKFSKQETMLAHLRSHSAHKPYYCHMCDFKFPSKDGLMKHLKTHSKQKKTAIFFPCPLCPNKYSTSASLRTHLSNHSTESKPYQCDFCDYICYTSELLRVHVQKHSGNRFRCEICLLSYPSEARLKAHIRDHLTTDKPLKCNICNTSFSSRAQLNRHMPIHSGCADPFVCYICSQSFPTLRSRRAHMSTAHNIENEEEWKASQPIVVRPAGAEQSETALDKYGFVEEDLAQESDSEEEYLHPEQHHFIGYPKMEKE